MVNHTLSNPAPSRELLVADVQWGQCHSEVIMWTLEEERCSLSRDRDREGDVPLVWVGLSGHWRRGEETYLFLLLIEVINDDTNEQVQGEEGAEDDEDDKVDVHVDVVLILRLLLRLSKDRRKRKSQLLAWGSGVLLTSQGISRD